MAYVARIIALVLLSMQASGGGSLRIAVVGLQGDGDTAVQSVITKALSEDARVVLNDSEQVKAAVAGIKYDGSINLTTREARRLGGAIGCDYFVIGKSEVLIRSDKPGESHAEAVIAIMMVDGRSGALVVFDLIVEKAVDLARAADAAKRALAGRAGSYVERLLEASVRQESRSTRSIQREAAEDTPAEGTARAQRFRPPEFLNRVKPAYTNEADLAGISATVEARVVFRANGQVGEIEITRWAGFGLEEAAIAAIRQLQFKPATRDGRPISVRGEVRYNFRRH